MDSTETYAKIFIDRVALAKQGDNIFGSVRPSVHLYALLLEAKSSKSYYQAKVFVCAFVISWRMQMIALMRSIGS